MPEGGDIKFVAGTHNSMVKTKFPSFIPSSEKPKSYNVIHWRGKSTSCIKYSKRLQLDHLWGCQHTLLIHTTYIYIYIWRKARGSLFQGVSMKVWCLIWVSMGGFPLFNLLLSLALAIFPTMHFLPFCYCTFEKEGLPSNLGHGIKVTGASVWNVSCQPERHQTNLIKWG